MRTFLSQKKFLFLALLEDTLFLLFLSTVIASSLEILLPGSLSHKIPLALLFTLFALALFFYLQWTKKEGILSYRAYSPSPALLFVLVLLLALVALFMTRAFGMWGALFQVFLLILTLNIWFRKK